MDCQNRVRQSVACQTMKRLIVAVLLVVGWAPLGSAQTLRISHIDVEQADAALIIMPNGKTLLVDSGKNRQGSRIKAVMDLAGVTRIDAFVNSHYHEDHFGGIDDLVKMGVSVLETYDRGKKEFVDEEENRRPPLRATWRRWGRMPMRFVRATRSILTRSSP